MNYIDYFTFLALCCINYQLITSFLNLFKLTRYLHYKKSSEALLIKIRGSR